MIETITVPALRVEQPIGTFFVATIKARVLLDTCFSEHVRAERATESGTYVLEGTQRILRNDRLRGIGEFISRRDFSFPNTIILGANYLRDGTINENGEDRWKIEQGADGCYKLVIPLGRKSAAIIDGQHRLFGFSYADASRLDTDLVCSVFLDVPKSIQASLFATINSTQAPVSKSLTYELFGYNVEDDPSEYWSPDKLAVYLARRLAVDEDSPLNGAIALAPEQDFLLKPAEGDAIGWRISMAVVVQGIVRLISSNPRQDANALMTGAKRTRLDLALARDDASVLRGQYLGTNDAFIYGVVLNFLTACRLKLWNEAPADSFITKTVGMQAQFDLLRLLIPQALEQKKLSVEYFASRLQLASEVRFELGKFNNASGAGRIYIRRVLEIATGLLPLETLPEAELVEIGLADPV